ncbi:hypothetical protein P8C59_000624 [Phyllachora maydis]|uniref:Single-strand DNA deaminase toxin A-like C-terminal domain-containing protein n=1 Tax=Phyllachora maydis TaxID=1825666 RepID=A0AAD9MBE0_9PEZI|nr:hypothetical protein P8C59_000624 [Phyllachora maydis]
MQSSINQNPRAPQSNEEEMDRTSIFSAVIRGDLDEVQRQRSQNRDVVHEKNNHGATTLMLAALMGRLAVFRQLLLCRSSAFSAQALKIYSDDALSERQVQYRREILEILRNPERLGCEYQRGNHHLSDVSFYRIDENGMAIMQPQYVLKHGGSCSATSTMGFIVGVEDKRPKAFAVSGWKMTRGFSKTVLDNGKYTRLMRRLSKWLRFDLPQAQHDNAGPGLPEHHGRFLACHVEKQLALFWVGQQLSRYLGTTDFTKMRRLRKIALPRNSKHAKIMLTHKPCTPVTVGVEVGLPQMSVDRARQYRRLSADVPDTSASPEPRTAMADHDDEK